MKILAIVSNSGSRFYRIIPQMKWMEKAGHQCEVIKLKEGENIEIDKLDKEVDVVILENIFSPVLINYFHKIGAKVVLECDDLIHTVPKTHYDYENVKGYKRYVWLFRVLRAVFKTDGFITTNKKLGRIYGWMAKKKLIFPNYCDFEHWVRPYSPNQGKQIRLLWAGSKSHTHDLLYLKPILKKFLLKHPEVKFLYIGMGGARSNDLYTEFVYGEDIFKDFPPNRESLVGVDAEIYPHILATLHADMAIAPLTKDYFNQFKTPCKYLEYSINKIPAVYSKWFYKDVVKHNETGYLAETEEEWLYYLEKLLKERKKIGENAYQDVLKNYDIRKYLPIWQKFIEQL